MPRRALIPCTLALVACAQILGGLEEGRARLESPDGGTEVEAAPPPCRALDGYASRLPIHVEHHGPAILGYQVKLELPTDALVAAGRMRADGGDIAITLADGVTRVPHWLEGGVGTAKTTLWIRLDLGDRPIDGWLYYGDAAAIDSSSMEETFVQGVLVNPYFDRDEGWAVYRERVGESTSSLQWSTQVGDGGAQLYLATSDHPNGMMVGLCQTIEPPDGEYRAQFDLDLLVQQSTSADLALVPRGSTNQQTFWSSRAALLVAPLRAANVETAPFQADRGSFCLLASAPGTFESSGLRVRFARLRLRRWLEGDRTAVITGSEASPCAP